MWDNTKTVAHLLGWGWRRGLVSTGAGGRHTRRLYGTVKIHLVAHVTPETVLNRVRSLTRFLFTPQIHRSAKALEMT